MQVLQKYLLSNVFRAPDDVVAAPEPAVVDPAVAAAADPPAGDDPPADPPADPPSDPTTHGNKGKTPWFLQRISEESAKARAADERAAKFEREAVDARALAERLQAGDKPDQRPAPRGTSEVDPALVRAEAQRQRLYEDTLDIRNAGMGAFQDFNQTLGVLNAIGATSDDFVADVIAASDKASAHVIFDKLAKDPEKAASLVGMDSRRRTAELTRMSMTAAPAADAKPAAAKPAAPAKSVSKAPAPPPPVDPSASKTIDGYSDEATDEQFTEKFNKRLKERMAARR